MGIVAREFNVLTVSRAPSQRTSRRKPYGEIIKVLSSRMSADDAPTCTRI